MALFGKKTVLAWTTCSKEVWTRWGSLVEDGVVGQLMNRRRSDDGRVSVVHTLDQLPYGAPTFSRWGIASGRSLAK